MTKNKYNFILLGKPREITEGNATGLHRENGFRFAFKNFMDMLEELGFTVIRKGSRKK
tara:strand:+ start:11688 stop:11861 length:174 start_codon:yes stop_codon:yes gene_type:complete